MTTQKPLTIIAPVKQDRLEQLFKTLHQINYYVDQEMPVSSFETIGTIHFARWLVIDYSPSTFEAFNKDFPKLVFSTNFDGEIHQQVKDLCEKASDIIDQLYEHCEGYPASSERNVESRVEYLNRYMIRPSAFYRGAPGRSLQQIRQEDQLHIKLREFLDSKSFDNYPAKNVLRELRDYILNDPSYQWVRTPVSLPRINLAWHDRSGLPDDPVIAGSFNLGANCSIRI